MWNLANGVWVAREAAVASVGVVNAIKNRPRLQILVQPARSDKDFEIVASNTKKSRAKITKAWIELADGSKIFPDKGWQDLSISIDSGESVTIRVPIKSIRKLLVNQQTRDDIKSIDIEDENGKLHKVKIPKSIKLLLIN
ncbi:hypothetical protein ACFLWR_00615 [Chloroflexota bacterium]